MLRLYVFLGCYDQKFILGNKLFIVFGQNEFLGLLVMQYVLESFGIFREGVQGFLVQFRFKIRLAMMFKVILLREVCVVVEVGVV